ncbi:MAG: two-component system histidine kinase PnpS [Peptococcaceae bacterium]
MQLRIRNRLTVSYLILILVSMSILGVALLWPLQNYFIGHIKQELFNNTELVNNIVYPYVVNENYQPIDQISKDLGRKIKTRITVIKNDGTVLGDSDYDINLMENHRNRAEINEALSGKKGSATRYSTTLDTDTMYVAMPLEQDGDVLAVIRLSLPLTEINKTLLNLKLILLTGIMLASSVAVILSLRLSSTITEPIEKINITANKISQGDLEQRIFLTTNDELGELAQAINDMTLALQQKIDEVTSAKQKLEAVLNHMVSGVIVISSKGKIQGINIEAERMFSTQEKKVLGKPYQGIIRNFGLQEIIEQVIEEGQVYSHEFSVIYPEKLTLKAYIAPVIQNGMIEQVVIVFHDITSLRQLERIKTDFVANASHELRTPVAAIKGFAETLLDGALEEPKLRERFITIIDKEADRLIRLINDLLDLSRLEAKGTEMVKEDTDIGQLLQDCTLGLSHKAEERNIELILDIAKNLPLITANKDMLMQAFINLIDNAIKYTNAGGKVEVSAAREDGGLIVKIKDSGIGIPKDDLPRIFERFYRVDKARSKDAGGTGLGLSIVKHIMEQHQGHVNVESEIGRGSVFYLTFPQAEQG